MKNSIRCVLIAVMLVITGCGGAVTDSKGYYDPSPNAPTGPMGTQGAGGNTAITPMSGDAGMDPLPGGPCGPIGFQIMCPVGTSCAGIGNVNACLTPEQGYAWTHGGDDSTIDWRVLQPTCFESKCMTGSTCHMLDGTPTCLLDPPVQNTGGSTGAGGSSGSAGSPQGGSVGTGGAIGAGGTTAEGDAGVVLSDSTPASAIVIGGKDSWIPFTEYTVTGPDWQLERTDISQYDGNGDWRDFTDVALAVDGQVIATGTPDQSFSRWVFEPATSISIQAGKKIQVWGKMAAVSSTCEANVIWHGVACSGHTPNLMMTHMKGIWGGVEQDIQVPQHTPNSMVLRKSMPIVTKQALSSSTLANVDQDLFKFQVAADSAGSIAMKQIVFQYVKTSGVSLSNFRMRRRNMDMDINTYAITNGTMGVDLINGSIPAGPDSWYVIFSMKPEMEESLTGSGNVYTLHATVSGADPQQSVTFSFYREASSDVKTGLVTDSLRNGVMGPMPDNANIYHVGSFVGTFIWSDNSEVPHSSKLGTDGGSIDWTNDQFLQDLTQSQTLRQ